MPVVQQRVGGLARIRPSGQRARRPRANSRRYDEAVIQTEVRRLAGALRPCPVPRPGALAQTAERGRSPEGTSDGIRPAPNALEHVGL